jgi:hypothetical protein
VEIIEAGENWQEGKTAKSRVSHKPDENKLGT